MHSVKRLIPATFVVLWATGFIGARYAMPWAEPFTFLAARFVLAAALFAGLVVVLGSKRASREEALHATGAGILMHGVYLGAVFWAIHRGMPAGLSALIVGLQPLITAVLAGKFLGEAILPRHWAGLAVGLAGVVIVLWPKLGALGGGVTSATLTASLVSVLGMSAGTIWQKRFASGGDLVAATMWQYVGGASVMIVASLAFETHTVVINGELIFAMAWLVLVLSIGAIFLLMVMIRDGEMSKVASLFYLVPAVTAVIAWALFDEQLNALQIAGMAITTFGVGLATARQTKGRIVEMRN
ncbi:MULTISPECIES: DMT family transporter [unclassified Mesorhizobium]|uniref:DMT family transporter n=1 Tax=unclassified Mesorhizobium TaxID=325217 RepID=UPI00112C04B5|nr:MULTISPECIES: DMT family transporter [unclassified Mesorhizobium]MBZ9699864.1 DMT family transporter [Mesorhizobium sp. CO1-1-3]MBZ9946307.1 DMT family transporter [Mesorhizobium sp. BR1-1-11]MBZ9961279.1 DMT family transporter [Mesorhizobium sp. BR1-1-14]TPJ05450.1 DMT family transporter [Mesorhizobium sp. B2-8-1]TPK57605.1 DMT family transporter [Mesorhizobium sp. B2-5-1]